ncbi:product required for copper resistance [Yarrowia lipolytica]|nr:product required for copper resistance [Yarrowia lipolytica]RDW38218.1 product required for copper resistance [Yarrowia lipolytica]
MVVIEGIKYACERCIRGHRVSSCTHTQQPLIRIKPKGRPATQCLHCREARKNKALHVKCKCGSSSSKHAATCPCYSGGGCICTNKHPQVLPPNSTTTGANGCIVINKAVLDEGSQQQAQQAQQQSQSQQAQQQQQQPQPQASPILQQPQMPTPVHTTNVTTPPVATPTHSHRALSTTPSLSPQPQSPHSPESALKSVNFLGRTNSSSSLSSLHSGRNKNRIEKVRPSHNSLSAASQLANSPSSPFYAVMPPAWVDSPTLVPTGALDASYLQILNDDLSSPLLDSDVFSSLDMEPVAHSNNNHGGIPTGGSRALASTDINFDRFESTSPSSILSSWNLWGGVGGSDAPEMSVAANPSASASASSIQTPPSSNATPEWVQGQQQPCSVSPADVMLPFKRDDQESVFLTEPLYL